MGIKLKGSLESSTIAVPGPGTYKNNAESLKMKAPNYGFGTSKRPEIGVQKLKTPGPGEYRVPSKIANLADFQMPGREDKNKYV